MPQTHRVQGKGPGIWIERIRREESFVMPTQHFHNSYEIYYLLEGTRLYFLNEQVYRVNQGGLVFIGPNKIHRTVEADNGAHERFLLEVERSAVSRVCQRLPGVALTSLLSLPGLVLQVEEPDQTGMCRLLEDLLAELRNPARTGAGEMALLHLSALFLRLLRGVEDAAGFVTAEESKKHREIYEITRYIADHYAQMKSLDDLCDRFFISKSHLCREFKRITGLTVQEYVSATRIIRSRQLLLESDDAVTAIAHQVGYNSITHFERVFKQHVGMPPLAFRRAAGKAR